MAKSKHLKLSLENVENSKLFETTNLLASAQI